MAWEQLSINKPHLVYIILGGFTSIFMLCSSIIKERLYIGEATVATICGIIFGPHAANLINPDTWGNVDQITLEFSRVVLVVQCFAVGVELPKAYMEKHWRSVVFLLVPVMTFGWLITSLFIWAVFNDQMNWLDSLVCAACVTATDPVLASSVVGKGKFAKRVPRHLRDLLSAESGCNDGMAFPFIYLGIYLVRYRPDANEVAFHWFCLTILYECIFGAVYGVLVGYIARRAIRAAHERDLIDRESFLVFYFVLALFCAGSGSLLGIDDLLVGFACGVGFSNDGWFQEKTEESHVSNVIDLLINLAFFVYFGTIIPWNLYSSQVLGTSPWKFVVIAILVLFFRRIPVMLALKPLIPDIKTWREALFAGHFGPIGVGALFVAILARAEFETESTTPLAHLPAPGFDHRNIIELIWPITTFLVITSIIVHGSSVAVFTLGRHINTLTFTMSYTQANEGMNWMDRLPRIQSRSRTSMSLQKTADSSQEDLEKSPSLPAAAALPIPRQFLRRQKEEDNPSRSSSARPTSRRRKWDSGIGPGGHVEQSAIAPQSSRKPQSPTESTQEKVDSDTTAVSSDESPMTEEGSGKNSQKEGHEHHEAHVIREGENDVIEDEDGNVLGMVKSPEPNNAEEEQENEENLRRQVSNLMDEEYKDEGGQKEPTGLEEKPEDGPGETGNSKGSNKRSNMLRKLSTWGGSIRDGKQLQLKAQQQPEPPSEAEPPRRQVPARAFKFGNTVIVEDEDGEVIKKYDLPQRPRGERKPSYVDPERTRQRLQKMGKWMGMAPQEAEEATMREEDPTGSVRRKSAAEVTSQEDDRIRFTMQGSTRRMSKADFIKQIQAMDPRARAEVVEDSNAPEPVKREAREEAAENERNRRRASQQQTYPELTDQAAEEGDGGEITQSAGSAQPETPGTNELQRMHSATGQAIAVHPVADEVRRHSVLSGQQTAAERRRRAASHDPQPQPARIAEEESDDDGTDRVPPRRRQQERKNTGTQATTLTTTRARGSNDQEETPAERRRREGALGVSKEDSDDEEEGGPTSSAAAGPAAPSRSTGIRFADEATAASASASDSAPRFGSVRWGLNRGR